jgi:hypothetical protein
MITFICLGLATSFDTVCARHDINLTDKGIKAGVAVEGNEFITTLARTNKPSKLFLFFYEASWIAAFASLGFFAPHLPAAIGGSLAFLIVDGVKHLIAARKWNILLHGGTIPRDATAWQKFLGFGQS